MNPIELLALIRFRLVRRLIDTLAAEWRALDSYHWQDANVFAPEALDLVQDAQRALADAVSFSVAEWVELEHGRTVERPVIPDNRVINLRQDVDDPVSVYRRPFRDVWASLDDQVDLVEAELAGLERLEKIADGDMQLTYAHANQAALEALPDEVRPRYWRRVPRGTFTCALCLVASTQRYRTDRLNPIHPACDCDVEPLPGDAKHVIDEDLLERVHAAVEAELGVSARTGRDAGGIDYRDLLAEITEVHGEMGEILVRPRTRKRPRSR